MIKNLWKAGVRLLPLLSVPIVLQHRYRQTANELIRNNIDNRVFVQIEVSNNPCEDRKDFVQLTGIEGYAAAVYDGHGGWQVSHYCSQMLLKELNASLQANKQKIKDKDQLIRTAIKESYKACEQSFLQAARIGYRMGFGRFARAGSCALVCVVANNKVYTGNTGDSLGILVGQSKDGQMFYTELNKQQNANHDQQRERLKKLFPNEEDVVLCKKQNMTSCYVKGRLQPTRSIGDLRLKYSQFNNPENYSTPHDFQTPLPTFTGPYISAEPEILQFDLNSDHKYIVVGTDGLWDQLGRQQVAQIVKDKSPIDIPTALISETMQKAASAVNLTVQQIRKIPTGKKRKIHDDITVLLLNLQHQYEI